MGACCSSQKDSEEPDRLPPRKNATEKTSQPDAVPNLSQFELRRVIGKGAFGKVKVVVHKKTSCTYALKYISKGLCIERHAAPNIIRERKILEILHHPLVCNLRFAFQDAEHLYLVTDLMLGGDIRFHLLRKTFTEAAIKHWIAETASALSYCHSRGIVHRDVKPDNILLTAEGHCKLADFNISTQIRGDSKPHSRSGSLFYMAPEIHQGQFYDFAVDYWSLGVVFFEALYGYRPFTGNTSAEVAKIVTEGDLSLPRTQPAVSPACENAILSLLTRDSSSRCNSESRLASLQFFSDLNWQALRNGQSSPIFVPGNGKNFDAAWELEEILLQDAPLEPRRNATRKSASKSADTGASRMHELLEKHFLDFDYTTAIVNLTGEKSLPSDDPLQMINITSNTQCSISCGHDPDFVDDEEKSVSLEVKTASVEYEILHPGVAEIAVTAVKGRGRAAKGRSKKSIALAPGVLTMKPGGRVRA